MAKTVIEQAIKAVEAIKTVGMSQEIDKATAIEALRKVQASFYSDATWHAKTFAVEKDYT